MDNLTLNKLIAVHNTLYQMNVSKEQTIPVAQCLLSLQDIIAQAQKELMPRDGQTDVPAEVEVNADKMEGITHE